MCERPKNIRSPDGKASYYIVGPIKIQNELIASYLKRKTGNECFVLEDISQVQTDDLKDQNRQKILLSDCQGKNLNGLLAESGPYINNC
jgi:hypothetical protein